MESRRGDRRTSPLLLRCWGCRGSIPSPGAATAGYGGNTSCLEIKVGGKRLIFDAGSGARPLGSKIQAEGPPPPSVDIFLTHFHWDHIQGFPFFSPLYGKGVRMDIHAPKQADVETRTLFAGQLGPIYFPVPFSAVAADVVFHDMNDGVWEGDGVSVRALRTRHPSFTVGYRIEAMGKAICYVPDNEMRADHYPVGEGWRARFLEFVSGADVLFHDAMFTDEEYAERVGWGHSTFRDALELAVEAGVRKLFFFHHDPERSDGELNRLLADHREEVVRRGLDLEVHAAFEGKQLGLDDL